MKPLFAAVSLACMVIVSTGAVTRADTLKLKKVTVLQPIPAPDIRFAPWAVAMEKGWLAEEGLENRYADYQGLNYRCPAGAER